MASHEGFARVGGGGFRGDAEAEPFAGLRILAFKRSRAVPPDQNRRELTYGTRGP